MTATDFADIDKTIAAANRYVVFYGGGRISVAPASSVTLDASTDIDYRTLIPVLALNEQEAIGVAAQYVAGDREGLDTIFVGSSDYIGRQDVVSLFRSRHPDVCVGSSAQRFRLVPGLWYAAEFIDDSFDVDKTSYSPVKIHKVDPKGTGRGEFALDFYHANYPEGVNGKRYDLQVVVHGKHFLVARSTSHDPVRVLQLYEISKAWLARHFGMDTQGAAGLEQWLDHNV